KKSINTKSQSFFRKVKTMLGMLRSLTYGQRLKLSERSVVIPTEPENIEPWVKRAEERQEKLEKKVEEKLKEIKASNNTKLLRKEKVMGAGTPNGECTTPQDKGYLSVDIPKVPRQSTLYYFETCCCEDDTGALLEALYQFVLAKKLLNPAILKVIKKYSPNRA